MPLHQMRITLIKLQRETLGWRLKIADGMGRTQFEVDAQMPNCLCRISIRAQWNREIRFQVLGRDRLVIFDLQPFGSVYGDRRNARAEDGTTLRLFRSALAHLQQPWIDGLLF